MYAYGWVRGGVFDKCKVISLRWRREKTRSVIRRQAGRKELGIEVNMENMMEVNSQLYVVGSFKLPTGFGSRY